MNLQVQVTKQSDVAELKVSSFRWGQRKVEDSRSVEVPLPPEEKIAGSVDGLEWLGSQKITTGSYRILDAYRRVYSDHSYAATFDTANNANGVNTIALRSDCLLNTISVQMYQRDDDLQVQVFRDIQYVDEFTGIYASGARLDVVNDTTGAVDYPNLDTYKYEFMTDGSTVILNNNYAYQVGKLQHSPITVSDLQNFCEDAGAGNNKPRIHYTKYFPLQAGSVDVWVADSFGNVVKWTEVSTFTSSSPTDTHFTVDKDRGILAFGGVTAEQLVLSAAISSAATSLLVYSEDNVEDWPRAGVLQVGSEQIKFALRTGKFFAGLTRGFNATTAATHNVGSKIKLIQQGKAVANTDRIYVGYEAIPGIYYEVDPEAITRTANVDLTKPYGVIQIYSAETNVSKLELKTDSAQISGDLYGPVYYGTDVARLTATAKDIKGNPVSDVEITFYAEAATLDVQTSNQDGESYTAYNAPYDDQGVLVDTVSVSGGNTIFTFTEQISPDAVPSEVTVYQILKSDPILGFQGNEVVVTAAQNAPLFSDGQPLGASSITIQAVLEESYVGGQARVLTSDGILHTLEITASLEQFDSNGDHTGYVLVLGNSIPSLPLSTVQKAWIFQEEAVEILDPKTQGVRVLLYEFSTNYQHPITGASGAYGPVRPDSVSLNDMQFTGKSLPVPAPGDTSNNLAGYVLVAPAVVDVFARCVDPATGQTVESNHLRLKLQLPNSLTGVDSSGALPVPTGLTLVTDSINVGTGLGGSNFLTVNPQKMDASVFTTGMFFG